MVKVEGNKKMLPSTFTINYPIPLLRYEPFRYRRAHELPNYSAEYYLLISMS